jgi:hypothetical protein
MTVTLSESLPVDGNSEEVRHQHRKRIHQEMPKPTVAGLNCGKTRAD